MKLGFLITLGLIRLLGFFGWLGLILILIGIVLVKENEKFLNHNLIQPEKYKKWKWVSQSLIFAGVVSIAFQIIF